MRVLRHDDARDFLARTATYRAERPVVTSVLSSVPLSVIQGIANYERCHWWVVEDDDERCVGAAFRTPPHNLHIGPMPEPALEALARTVSIDDDGFPGLSSGDEQSRAFLAAYATTHSAGSSRSFAPGLHSVIYELGELHSPDVSGSSRSAEAGDVDLVLEWTLDFQRFLGHHESPDRFSRELIAQRVANDAYRFWMDDGVPVAMAGYALPVDVPGGLMTRIGPVFTPEDLRGLGYGSAVTAALCAELRERGSRVMLYADADYPTSNHVYRKLGFEAVGSEREYRAID